MIPIAKPHTRAQERNDPPIPHNQSRDGKICKVFRFGNREQPRTSIQLTFMERKTVIDLRNAVMEVALPLTLPAIQIEFTL